jgi:hypothetical protein
MHSKTQQGMAFGRLNLQGSSCQHSTLSLLMPQQDSRCQRSIVWGLMIELDIETLQGM